MSVRARGLDTINNDNTAQNDRNYMDGYKVLDFYSFIAIFA